MPFTPAHALAAWPFARFSFLEFEAVVVGTLLPDLPLFVPIAPSYAITHSPVWSVPVGLPFGIAVVVLMQWCKAPLIELLPDTLRARALGAARPRWPCGVRRARAVLLGLAVGILTHVVWDAFTHQGRWGVDLVPALHRTWHLRGGVALPGYKILQYGCGIGGLFAIAWLVRRWFLRQEPGSDSPPWLSEWQRAAVWGVLLGLIPCGFAVVAYRQALAMRHDAFHVFGYVWTVGSLSAQVLVLLALTLAYHVRGARDPSRTVG